MIVDFHSHIYPLVYLEALKSEKIVPNARMKAGSWTLSQKESKRTLAPDFYDIDLQIKQMEKYGIDHRVISLPNPWLESLSTEKAIKTASSVNDELSEMVLRDRSRLSGLASLPMVASSSAIGKELRRAVQEKGLRGAIIPSNVNGKGIDDKKYWPMYKEAASLGVPIFLHPFSPPDVTRIDQYSASTVLTYPYETALAVLRLVYSGILDELPSLRFFIPHLGGVLPYLSGRIDASYRGRGELNKSISKPPSEYIKERFYSDLIIYSPEALACGYKFFGPSRLLIGTDYPFIKPTARSFLDLLEQKMGPSSEELEQIEYKNALELLGKSS